MSVLNHELLIPARDTRVLDLLFRNLDALLSKGEAVVSNPNAYALSVPCTGIFALYVAYPRLYLGDLLRLWTDFSNWHSDGMYTYAVYGSPLSGMNRCNGFNAKSGEYEAYEKESLNVLAHDAQKVVGTRPFNLEDAPALDLRSRTAGGGVAAAKSAAEFFEKLEDL